MPYFITLEGIEGVGKSSVIKTIEKLLIASEQDYMLTREPGGTPLAEKMRDLVLNNKEEPVTEVTELLLFFAARSQHIDNKIKPALDAGKWVICDRFTDASYAYQGAGRGMDIKKIEVLEQWVQQSLQPDMTILLDAPVEVANHRASKRSEPDRIEAEEQAFFNRARTAYLDRAKKYPKRFHVVNANQDFNLVEQAITDLIQAIL